MSTQVTGAWRRSRLIAALVALALTVAVLVVAIQASSIWSTKASSQVRPVPAHIAPSANPDLRTSSHISIGCRRPKYGCQKSRTTSADRL
jgi:hypothetical protein